jgi:hypothetical protein
MSGNAESVFQLFRTGEERDATKLFALYHRQIEFHEAPSLPFGGTYIGFDVVLEHARRWQETWDPLQTNDERRMPPRIMSVTGAPIEFARANRWLPPTLHFVATRPTWSIRGGRRRHPCSRPPARGRWPWGAALCGFLGSSRAHRDTARRVHGL